MRCITNTSQTASEDENSLLPTIPGSTVALEVYHRAPTLIARSDPGSGGAVRLWAPDRMRLWRYVIGSLASSFLLLYGSAYCILAFLLCPASLFLIKGLIRCTSALLSPCYITTDDTGIGIRIPGGSCSFRWEDIERVEFQLRITGSSAALVIYAPDPVRADLTGYPEQVIDELSSMIKDKADLTRHPKYKSQWIKGARLQALTAPVIAGIGVTFERNRYNRLVVAAVEDHSPAGNTGLMAGDEILSINHLTVEKLDEVSAAAECVGPEGLIIHLKVIRELWVGELAFEARTRSPFC